MFSYVEIAVMGCDLPEGECADITDVENTYLQFFALQSRIDFEEIDQDAVLKKQQDNVNLLVLDSTRVQKLNLFYTQSSLTLDDSPWKLFEIFKTTVPFFEYVRYYKYEERADSAEATSEKAFYKIYLRADTSSRHYRRETYSMLEYLGDLGGLIDIIFIMTAAFVTSIIER